MNLEVTKAGAKFAISRGLLKVQKNSPVILMVAGIGGMIATTVMVAQATLKLEPLIDELDANIATSKAVQAQANTSVSVDGQTVVYTEEEFKRVRALLYVRSGAKIAKLYLPAATLGVASIGLIVGGHTVLNRRNLGLTAAYAALDQSFNRYKERVVEALGTDREKELRQAIFSTEEVVDEDTGETTQKFLVTPPVSIYGRYFDELNKNWSKEHDYNLVFLRATQNYLNDQLRAKGHVFLNEVYDALGIPRSREGALVGWVMGNGDNVIEFGLNDPTNEMAREFVNGYEKAIFLDFNVDGVIYDKID